MPTKVENVLSRTEKKNSLIIRWGDKPLTKLFNEISGIIEGSKGQGNKEYVRIVLFYDNVIKLQTFDNGTPFIFEIDENNESLFMLDQSLDIFCDERDLVYSKVKCKTI